MILAPEAMAWLAATLAERPREVEARPVAVARPTGLPDALLAALDAKLATAAGLARHAWLAAVAYADGREGHLLAFVDAAPGAETSLARAVGEALTFSGVEAGETRRGLLPRRRSRHGADREGRVALRPPRAHPDRGAISAGDGSRPAATPAVRKRGAVCPPRPSASPPEGI
jgi:hypothetical protein